MKKVFFLKTCSTCARILKQFDLRGWDLREIKSDPLTVAELDQLFAKTQSYRALFNTRSTQIKTQDLDVAKLTEEDFQRLLLSHYAFLKRPVFFTDDRLFIGNDKKTLANLQHYFRTEK